ncbi:MAG: type II toxin-antitoxin system HicB family antitoxin [Methylococcales bacterium]
MLFEPAVEGGYTVTCPALPGVITEGDTLELARSMVKDAIEGYLEIFLEDGEPIPVEERAGDPIAEKITVELKSG